ncbi:glycerophosphodiester phosphodiesterase [Pseudactinotalea terrae]|uniref:glycerophosphodiester phosphodiesterase n=1 Tax=Pseudactinotalea terrae TaxID=1743262 RepID=UPI0012E0CD90|nr:glycerophosphodiester phosphodiesterase family protein [Pseudactinotalea terrae]
MSKRPVIVAHRGNSVIAPQNTMAAFEAAWRAGADYVELDIQVTSDGEAAVIHNSTLDETTSGTGPVAQHTAAEVALLDAGSWFSPVYAGERVPLLSDVVEFLRTHPEIGLVLEVKGDWPTEPLRRVLDGVTHPFLEGRLIVESFSLATMATARDAAPQLRRELLIDEIPDNLLGLLSELGVSGCNPNGRRLLEDPSLLGVLQGAGLTVIPWTLNEPEQWALALEAGVDGIVTDRPDRLAGWLSGRGV